MCCVGAAAHIMFHGKLEDFLECVNSVLTTNRVTFEISYMIVRSEHDLDGVLRCYDATVSKRGGMAAAVWNSPCSSKGSPSPWYLCHQ